MSIAELKIKLVEDQQSLMNFRFQKSMGQLEHHQEIKNIRREIAQIKTVLREFDLRIRGKELENG